MADTDWNKGWEQYSAQSFERWKEGFCAGMRMIDAALESAAKMRNAQQAAASETHSRALEIEQKARGASTPLELWTLQCNWAMENATRSLGYWRSLFEAMNEANGKIAECMRGQLQSSGADWANVIDRASVSAPAGSLAPQDLVKTALVSVDATYGQMVKSSQQWMELATQALSAATRAASGGAGAKPDAPR